jgi:superfamily II DNA or RNA helicase
LKAFSDAVHYKLKDYQEYIIFFVADHIIYKDRFMTLLLRPGLGKTHMIPVIVELMKLKLNEDEKILIIVPEEFLAANTRARLSEIDSSYELVTKRIRSKD